MNPITFTMLVPEKDFRMDGEMVGLGHMRGTLTCTGCGYSEAFEYKAVTLGAWRELAHHRVVGFSERHKHAVDSRN